MKNVIIVLLLSFLSLSYSAAQIISTVAGNGVEGYSGDGGQATAAEINYSYGVAIDAAGNMYIADQSNQRVRKVNTAGIISTLAGIGISGYSGDGGQATSAEIGYPQGVAVDAAGNVYIADATNERVRMVNVSNGIINTVAGNGIGGYSGDGGQATNAELNDVSGVWVDAANNIYIGDMNNNRVRKIAPTGIISTIAGNGTGGFSGDGGQATSAELNGPDQITTDAAGNLYISDYRNNRVRKVTTAGIISTVAGTGVAGYNGDNIQATAAEVNGVESVAIDAAGNLYLADLNERIRKIDPTGMITTYAGTGVAGYNGDGIPATTAEINLDTRVAVDNAGNVYIGDELNGRIRKVGAAPLPIRLLFFTVSYNSAKNNVGLNWATASEVNNKVFTVERSADGETYSAIATVNGAGNSSVTLTYNTIDPSPLFGTSYYRLKQTDYDGHYTYSPIATVTITPLLTIYPLPAGTIMHIRMARYNSFFSLSVYTLNGQEILRRNYNTGQTIVNLDVSTLPQGLYLLKFGEGNGSVVMKRIEIAR